MYTHLATIQKKFYNHRGRPQLLDKLLGEQNTFFIGLKLGEYAVSLPINDIATSLMAGQNYTDLSLGIKKTSCLLAVGPISNRICHYNIVIYLKRCSDLIIVVRYIYIAEVKEKGDRDEHSAFWPYHTVN